MGKKIANGTVFFFSFFFSPPPLFCRLFLGRRYTPTTVVILMQGEILTSPQTDIVCSPLLSVDD
jgi:hypothetical protein